MHHEIDLSIIVTWHDAAGHSCCSHVPMHCGHIVGNLFMAIAVTLQLKHKPFEWRSIFSLLFFAIKFSFFFILFYSIEPIAWMHSWIMRIWNRELPERSAGAHCAVAESVKMDTRDYSMLQNWIVNCCVAPITRRKRRENDDCATQKCLIRRRSYCYITRRAAIEQAAITSSADCLILFIVEFSDVLFSSLFGSFLLLYSQ